LHGPGFRETGDRRTILAAFRELGANALFGAGSSLARGRGARRALAGDVATQAVPAHRMGHRRQLRGVAVHSVAMAPSVRGAHQTYVLSIPVVVRRGVARLRRSFALRGFRRWRSQIASSLVRVALATSQSSALQVGSVTAS